MNLRVISGEFGGRPLTAPDGSVTHPMGERVRNALFNIVSSEVIDAEVLDVFAGSGAIGIEALSRGAKRVTFVERDRAAHMSIKKNIQVLGINDRVIVAHSAIAAWLKRVNVGQYDIIFADPPYDDLQLSTVSLLLDLLKPGALMVLSQPGRSEVPTKPGVVVVDNRSYGNANLTFYRRVE